ncbi:MAG TPA: hypothetical protein VNI77_06795 [Nitrososphaera sp.]|nr:hypothetical protein [Nitrososphaera sp.]
MVAAANLQLLLIAWFVLATTAVVCHMTGSQRSSKKCCCHRLLRTSSLILHRLQIPAPRGSLLSVFAACGLSCNALMISKMAESPDPEEDVIVLEALPNIVPGLNINISSLRLR